MKRWTQDEENELREHYQSKGVKYCFQVLNRSYRSIMGKALGLGLTKSAKPAMPKWTEREKNLLKQYYSTQGSKYCIDLLNKSYKSIRRQASLLCVQAKSWWTKDEEIILIKYYVKYGGKYCSKVLGRSCKSIYAKVFLLGLTETTNKRWNKSEEDILKRYYPTHGIEYCCDLLNRTHKSISGKVNLLNLHTDTIHGFPQKEIIKKLINNRVISLCKIHGKTPHYLKKNGKINACVQCTLTRNAERRKTDEGKASMRKAAQKYKSTPRGKFICRLRVSLHNAMRSKNITKTQEGCFRLLPYSPQELAQYLEKIRLLQDNQCPMCYRSYDTSKWSIDHIIPIKTAETEEDILELFNLNNLSLLCQSCNSSKGAKMGAVTC